MDMIVEHTQRISQGSDRSVRPPPVAIQSDRHCKDPFLRLCEGKCERLDLKWFKAEEPVPRSNHISNRDEEQIVGDQTQSRESNGGAK